MVSNDLVWETDFTSRLGLPMLVGVTWRHDLGLDVYVDGICAGFVDVPRQRTEETPAESEGTISSVSVESFRFVDSLRPIESLVHLENEGETLSLFVSLRNFSLSL